MALWVHFIAGEWGVLPATILTVSTLGVAALLLCHRGHRYGRFGTASVGAGASATDALAAGPRNRSRQQSAHDNHLAVIDVCRVTRRYLGWRSLAELIRIAAVMTLVSNVASVAGQEGDWGLSVPWIVVAVPWMALDIYVAVGLLMGWKQNQRSTPSVPRLLQWLYTLGFGAPLGTVVKVLLAMHMYNYVPAIMLALICAVSTFLISLAMGELKGATSGMSTGRPLESARRSIWLGVPLAIVACYLALSMAMLLRVTMRHPDDIGMGENDHNYEAGFFLAFPDDSWFAVLLPVWAILAGALLATIADAVASFRAARRFKLPRSATAGIVATRVADVLTLIGALTCGLLLARHHGTISSENIVGSGPFLVLLVVEGLAVINVLAGAALWCRARCTSESVLVNDAVPTSSSKAFVGSESAVTDSGISLRESDASEVSLEEADFSKGAASADSANRLADGSGSAVVQAYGTPYIDNPLWNQMARTSCADDKPQATSNENQVPMRRATRKTPTQIAYTGRISVASTGSVTTFDAGSELYGEALTRDTVRIGMCVYINASAADPNSGLFGDTVGCNGMVGVVQQADETDTCQVFLSDGRQQWVQCQALVQVEESSSTVFSGLSPASVGSTHGEETEDVEKAYASLAAKDVMCQRTAIAALGPEHLDIAIRGKSLLQTAAGRGQLTAVSLLLGAGADPNIVDAAGNTALHLALGAECKEDSVAVAAALIEGGCNYNRRNARGLSPLHMAAVAGHTVAAELLVAMGCHVDLRTRSTSETPLFLAIKSASHKIVRLLVEQAGCDINATDGDGDTPLHLAFAIVHDSAGDTKRNAAISIARFLIEHGANAIRKNQHGVPALDMCPDEWFAELKSLFVSAQVQALLNQQNGQTDIKVGNRVRLNPSVQDPVHGMQGITNRDVLVVRAVNDAEVAVSFVDPDILLRFKLCEVQRIFDASGAYLSASSNDARVLNLFDPDNETYWQSDGERGQHWVQIELTQPVEIRALEIEVHEGGVAFIPKRLEVLASENAGVLSPLASAEVATYGWTALVPNDCGAKVSVLRICVRSCHESGMNCRIARLRLQCNLEEDIITIPSSAGKFTPVRWEDCTVGSETGTILQGRYLMGRKIAKGGYGVTYAAVDQKCANEPVLVKFLHRLPGLELFRREARRLREIKHPQVPRLKEYFEVKLDSGETEAKSKFALVMEIIQGQNLVEVLDNEGVWNAAATKEMLLSVLGILTHVHRKGILHRDIKAANIMRRDRDGQYFLIDFGASVTAQEERKIIGTPGYMAPEAAYGRSCCESDLFGLGATGLFLLKGEEPYRLINKARRDSPFGSVIQELADAGRIDSGTRALLEALLQSDPSRRKICVDNIMRNL